MTMRLPFRLGKDDAGNTFQFDLADMPHMLVAGATGSGKSVFLNGLLLDLINGNADTDYMLVDPKRVEFGPYDKTQIKVYTDDRPIANLLEWTSEHMEERFDRLKFRGVRDIDAYNAARPLDDHMSRIVIVVDELASLMLGPERDRIELPLTRIAGMSRAVGIHLVLATQRPTTDVVTGLLKANIPARIAFSVISQIDSRVILDEPGAEKLLGKGQMLVRLPGTRGLRQLQGRNVTTDEVDATVARITEVHE
jgi:S-DNA-T family DNA segregation ATPase FtsK/SpoIIIE